MSRLFSLILSAACSALVMSSVANAIVKTHLTAEDANIDYFAVLGLHIDDAPTPQEVITAFRRQMFKLHSDVRAKNGAVGLFDAKLLVDAKDVLSSETLRVEYLHLVARRFNNEIRVQDAPKDAPPLKTDLGYSAVGTILYRGNQPITMVTRAYNTGSRDRPVAFFRMHPDENSAVLFTKDIVDGAPATFKLIPPSAAVNLNPKWRTWSESGPESLRLIQDEFQSIARQGAAVTSRGSPEYKDTEAFLYWWFAQPQSILHQDIVLQTLQQLPAGSQLSLLLMRASVSDSAWRSRSWVTELLPIKESFFGLAPVMGTPRARHGIRLT